jgi:plasmid rolling circle replication initiator protein Rep
MQVPAGPEGLRYLTDYSPQDKPWDVHRAQAQQVEALYQGTVFDGLAGRIRGCSGYLGFSWEVDRETGEMRLKLRAAEFCRVRHCPVCQWRRSMMWQARFLKALPAIEQAYPTARWLFLTLTVRNCPITDLRATIQSMNKAWHRLVKRSEFRAVLGWIRTTEVTKGQDGLAHPHFHVLLMVRPSYFSSKYYVKHDRWVDLWQECARLDYRPSVRIESVKPKLKPGSTDSPLRAAIAETLKYAVKPEDMMDRDWLLELTKQVHKLRFIASGGALKDILRETEESNEDLMLLDDGEASDPSIFFDWRREIRRYTKRQQ